MILGKTAMGQRHITIVVGTRPEAIKIAPVYLAIKARPGMRLSLLATAQHRQMLDQVLSIFGITPDVDLDVMRPDQRLPELSARLIVGVQEALAQ